jgi:opacity protein-like surface antigen
MPPSRLSCLTGVSAVLVMALTTLAGGQSLQRQPQQRQASGARASSPAAAVTVRGFADVGMRTFTASESIGAVLGNTTATVYGGGVGALLPWHTYVALRVSRLRERGQRVFVSSGQTFPLGIRTTITETPIEISGGYRLERWRAVPYGGGGLGWHRYAETSDFATGDENVKDTHMGYHVLGGVEFRVWRWLSAAGEGRWTTVPDALAANLNSVARELGESNLGGAAAYARIIIGR